MLHIFGNIKITIDDKMSIELKINFMVWKDTNKVRFQKKKSIDNLI